jgi:hypothetical protein
MIETVNRLILDGNGGIFANNSGFCGEYIAATAKKRPAGRKTLQKSVFFL